LCEPRPRVVAQPLEALEAIRGAIDQDFARGGRAERRERVVRLECGDQVLEVGPEHGLRIRDAGPLLGFGNDVRDVQHGLVTPPRPKPIIQSLQIKFKI